MKKKNIISALLSLTLFLLSFGCTNSDVDIDNSTNEKISSTIDTLRVSYSGTHVFNVTETEKDFIKDGKTDYKLVVSSKASAVVANAVTEFRYFFEKATGINLDVIYDNGDMSHSANQKYISIGETSLLKTSGVFCDIKVFGRDGNMSIMRELALLATDKNKETKKYRFIPSNPRGYAEWFKEKTLIGHNEKGMLFENIERVPTYPKKTVLQKSIQILKRHRDVYFLSRNDEYKPISMIITTLAAQCYNGENNIYEFICKALLKMPTLIVRENDQYVVKNPVMSNENFADKWKEKPQKAVEFFNWVNDAYVDFVNLKELTTYSEVDKTFKEIFSQKPVDRLMQKYGEYLREEKNTSYCPQIIEKSKALTMLERIPHRKRPPWNLPRKFRVGIQGTVSFNSGKSYQNFSSGELLPKECYCNFFLFIVYRLRIQ